MKTLAFAPGEICIGVESSSLSMGQSANCVVLTTSVAIYSFQTMVTVANVVCWRVRSTEHLFSNTFIEHVKESDRLLNSPIRSYLYSSSSRSSWNGQYILTTIILQKCYESARLGDYKNALIRASTIVESQLACHSTQSHDINGGESCSHTGLKSGLSVGQWKKLLTDSLCWLLIDQKEIHCSHSAPLLSMAWLKSRPGSLIVPDALLFLLLSGHLDDAIDLANEVRYTNQVLNYFVRFSSFLYCLVSSTTY